MKIRVGSAYYSVSPSFMTLLRYRTNFDESYLNGQFDNADALIRLVYAGIQGEKPEFYDFYDAARKEKGFMLAARCFRDRLLRPDGEKHKASSETTDKIAEYEYSVLSVWAIHGLYFPLLEEMTLAQAVRVMKVLTDIKNPKEKPKEMTREQRASFYGITPDREARLLAYLTEHPEEGTINE